MPKSGFPKGCGGSGPACPGEAALYRLYLAEALATAVTFAAIALHFPSRPSTPPTASAAAAGRLQETRAARGGSIACRSARQLSCASSAASRVWVLAICFSLPQGVSQGWSAVLAINMKQTAGVDEVRKSSHECTRACRALPPSRIPSLPLPQVTSGWFGCAMTMLGCVGGTLVGRLADKLHGRVLKGGVLW